MSVLRCLRSTLLVLLTALAVFTACVASAAPPTNETLRLAVHSNSLRDVSRTDVEVTLKLWATEMAKTLNLPAEIRLYTSMDDIHRDMVAGRANFVVADGIDILRYFSRDSLSDGFGGFGRAEDSLVLVARKADNIHGVEDLSGRRVVLLSDNELSDLWLATSCLRVLHQSCAQAHVSVSKEKRSGQQVLKVFFGTDDAALVRSHAFEIAAELNPQISQRLKVVARIPMYAGPLGLFSSRLSQSYRDYVVGKVPEMLGTPRGRQILELLQSSRIERLPVSALDPIRDLMTEHDMLLGRNAIGKTMLQTK